MFTPPCIQHPGHRSHRPPTPLQLRYTQRESVVSTDSPTSCADRGSGDSAASPAAVTAAATTAVTATAVAEATVTKMVGPPAEEDAT